MSKKNLLFSMLCLGSMTFMLFRCAVIPICPGSLMPIVEIQVNNTASNHDDYGSTTSYTTCRARITNFSKFGGGKNFPGGVTVEFRNPSFVSNLQFSSSGGAAAGSASIFQTLPDDGGWLTFYVKGTATSAVEKSAIIEIATSGTCDEVVVARKAMMIPSGAAPIASTLPQVEVEVGSVSTLDDYVTWAPTYCQIRWINGTAAATLNVVLQNMTGTDHLRFANSTLAGGATATNTTLPLTLNGDGSWTKFYLAGNFSSPSTTDKDAILEVKDASTTSILSREGVMVRIRKNANNLTVDERNRYLEAQKKLDLTYNKYIDFVKTHSRDNTGAGGSIVAHRQAHSGSAFLPWHRAFILHLERLLQASDPSVALPYWKFDVNAPNIFTADFMGSNSGGNMATLAATNPIVSWNLPGEGVPVGIQRQTPYGDGGHPTVATETATLGLGSPAFTYVSFKTMEVTEHNPAHSTSGFTNASGAPLAGASWIAGSPAIAQRDPLFYSLHCNVDRLWAKWQWLRNRNTVTDVSTYDLQGSFTTPAPGVAAPAVTFTAGGQIAINRGLGEYADDTMWPWDNVTGGAAGTPAERPNIAILTPFPITLGGVLPLNKPTVKSVLDYLSITSTSPATGLGFAYDDFFPY